MERARIQYEGRQALSCNGCRSGRFGADPLRGATRQTPETPSWDGAGQDVSGRLPEWLAANAHGWDKARSSPDAGSACRAGHCPECIAEYFGAGRVSGHQWTGPLEAKAAQWPSGAWSEAKTTVWREETVQAAQSGCLGDQPGGWERRPRFAGVRHRAAEELLRRPAFLTTHQQEGSARLASEPHIERGRRSGGGSERLRDLDLYPLPCQDLMPTGAFPG